MTKNPLQIVSLKGDALIVANHVLTRAQGWQPGQHPPPPNTATPMILHGSPVGLVAWDTAKAGEEGLFVQRVLSRRNKYVRLLEDFIKRGLITTHPICTAAKAAGGDVTVCRDVIVWPAEATKAFDFETAVLRRALGLDFNPRLAALRLKQKSNEAALLALEMRLRQCY